MSILTILQGAWAIPPVQLSTYWDIYERHLLRDSRPTAADLNAIEAATGRPMQGARLPVSIVDGVAVIPVMGPLIPRANMMQEMSGATSYSMLASDIEAALDDPTVKAMVLDVDSPGGSVNQLFDTADVIRAAALKMPVLAWTDGSMTSAAQLLGAATGNIYIGSDTTELGSIGVIRMHRDISKAEEQQGEKTTLIYSGKYKATGSPYGPLTEADRQLIQERTDYAYTAFINKMADYLGESPEHVSANLADARIFNGRQAIEAGLAKGMLGKQAIIALAAEMANNAQRTTAGGSFAGKPTKGERMTRAELQEQHPALYAEVYNAGKQEAAAQLDAAKLQATTAERDRITAILGIPGPAAKANHDLLLTGIAEGKTAGDVALLIQHKEAALNEERREAIKKGSTQPAPAADAGMGVDDEAAATAMIGDAMATAAADWIKRN